MAGVVKKLLIVSVPLICVLITSCTMKYHNDTKKESKTWIKYFKEEDAEGLLKLFCSDIRDNYSEETMKEIDKAFEFIDGDIVSYEFESEYSLAQAKDNFKTKYYCCYPVCFIETSIGEKYTIMFCYNYICTEKPELEGVESIRIINYKGDSKFSGDEVFVGKIYENE